MPVDGFDVESWVGSLDLALQKLAAVDRARGHRGHSDPSEGAELDAVHGILSGHPAWAALATASDDRRVCIQFPNNGCVRSLSAVIRGLMARGRESGEGGFRVACTELSLILAQDDEGSRDPCRAELLTGYHVVLFQGLIFREEIRLEEAMKIVPFGQLADFFDARNLERLVPRANRYNLDETLSAIIKPFRWKPDFRNDCEGMSFVDSWSGVDAFCEDAESLIELLALFHGGPVVRLASIGFRLHRRACLLLGSMDIHDSITHAASPPGAFGSPVKPVEARQDAIDGATRAFAARDGERYVNCAPMITRLAEALARQGRFATDDRILDVAIALERLYMPDDRGISAQLQECVAGFLGGAREERCRMKGEIKHFFDVRSAIIHWPKDAKKKRLLEERPEAFRNGFELARRSAVKMLGDEQPPD